jgi:O-antigen ligase
MGMPMLWLMSRNARSKLGKLLPLCFVPVILYVAYRTGSRAGMLALLVMLVLYFIRASGFKKMQMIALAVVGVAVLASSSDRLLKRLALIPGISSEEAPADDDAIAAEGSTEGRTFLLLKSLEFTIYHPLLGVGPGAFQMAEQADAIANNRRPNFHVTHNSYTEVSSECGIPALLLYVGAIFSALGATTRVSKMAVRPGDKDAEDIRQGGLYLQLSLVTLMVGMFFLSMAYTGLIFIICGLAMALERAAKAEYMTPATRSSQNTLPLSAPPQIPALSRIR